MNKEDVIDFLFWLQYAEQTQLLKDWTTSHISNGYVADRYLEYLKLEKVRVDD